jgi:hypothetical protein
MFRTELTIAPANGQLARTARVLTMGSCFADSIGARLVANKVEARVNPFGTVFQPLALARLLRAAAGEEVDWQRHLVQARGRWQSYDLHSSIGADSPVDLLLYIQEVVRQTNEFLRNADVVMLTLGTAWAYRLRETGELVSNCHKQPADLFVRELLTPDEIINALAETHAYLRRLNPDLRFILTVSPVRHVKDTLQLNSVSKSVVRLATHILSDLLPDVAYFPAFELLVDDLRDYRFYASDMLHPSEVAEDYIWEKFARAYFDADFGRFRKEWAAVRQSLGHRPLHEGAPEHRQFLENTREKLEQISLRKVDVTAELRTVQTRLAALPEPVIAAAPVEAEDNEERIDIGEDSVVSTVKRVNPQETVIADSAEAMLSATIGAMGEVLARAPRLSPEEFRAQRAARAGRPERGRRDGRGKDQPAPLTENEEFQSAASLGEATPARSSEATESFATIEQKLNELAGLEAAATTAETSGAEGLAAQEQVKKKKRRSRGGAKRTARKHALRLAAETDLEEGQSTMSDTVSDVENSEEATLRPESRKSSVIVKSQPVKRGGRRDEYSRVPRVPLFATPSAEPDTTTQQVDAELGGPEIEATVTPILPVETPEVGGDSDVAELIPTPASPSRNSRNRKKKKAAKAAAEANASAPDFILSETDNTEALPIADAVQLSGVSELQAQDDENTEPQLFTETGEETGILDTPITEPVAVRASANKPARRAKGRAISGGRAEKPAVDTPVVPVPDPTVVRTQVAAGRLTGASASLVVPAAPTAAKATKVVMTKPANTKGGARKTVAGTNVQDEPTAPADVETTAPALAELAVPITSRSKGKSTTKAKAAAEQAAEASPNTPDTVTTAQQPLAEKKTSKKTSKAPVKAADSAAAVEPVPIEKDKPKAKSGAKKAVPPTVEAKPTAKKAPAKTKTPKAAATKPTTAKAKTSKKSDS